MKAIALVKYEDGRWAVWINKLGLGVMLDKREGAFYWKRYILTFFDYIRNNKEEMKRAVKSQSKYLVKDYIIIEGGEVYEFINKIEEFMLLQEIIE